MENNRKIVEIPLVPIVAMMLSLVPFYIPPMEIVAFLIICVPFAISSVMVSKRTPIATAVISLIVLFIFTDIQYATGTYMMYILPSIIMGRIIERTSDERAKEKGEPVFAGIILYTIAIILYISVSKHLMNNDILGNFIKSMQESLDARYSAMPNANISSIEKILPGELDAIVRNTVASVIFVQGFFYAVSAYYITMRVLSNKFKIKREIGKISEFNLPGDPIINMGIMFILIYIAGHLSSAVKSDVMLFNLQIFADILFISQGIAVCIYFIKASAERRGKASTIFPIAVLGFLTAIGGMFLMIIIGMLDTFMDFRRIKPDRRKIV